MDPTDHEIDEGKPMGKAELLSWATMMTGGRHMCQNEEHLKVIPGPLRTHVLSFVVKTRTITMAHAQETERSD